MVGLKTSEVTLIETHSGVFQPGNPASDLNGVFVKLNASDAAGTSLLGFESDKPVETANVQNILIFKINKVAEPLPGLLALRISRYHQTGGQLYILVVFIIGHAVKV